MRSVGQMELVVLRWRPYSLSPSADPSPHILKKQEQALLNVTKVKGRVLSLIHIEHFKKEPTIFSSDLLK